MAGLRLSGRLLALREFEPRDEQALHAIASDPQVTAYTDFGPNRPADTRAFLATAVAQADTPEARLGYHLAATEVPGGDLVGWAALDVESPEHRRGEVGFAFAPRRWGRGYATEAMRLLLAFGFGELDLHRISADCHPDNPGCARVLEKAGMTLEGRLRDHEFVRGAWRDSLLYARLDSEPG
jgi:RimJ/RimL family protein N-acetyltransferase